eukprot:NODE_971_length_2831_cov_1.606515.p2 type:complete len:195 gc:universal NODE_971_length_2831_cov_1.606515:591-1175(+)
MKRASDAFSKSSIEKVQLKAGDTVPVDSVKTIDNIEIPLINSHGKVHLNLRRFSGCPLSNLNMRETARELSTIQSAGIREVIVLHSDPEVIMENQGTAEWAKGISFVSDPHKIIYKKCGAGTMPGGFEKVKHLVDEGMKLVCGFKKGNLCEQTDLHQLPMELIVDCTDGTIIAVHYAEDPHDQWTAEEIVNLVK